VAHDQGALALADGSHDIDDPGREVLAGGIVDLHPEPLIREQRRQVVEIDLALGLFRVLEIERYSPPPWLEAPSNCFGIELLLKDVPIYFTFALIYTSHTKHNVLTLTSYQGRNFSPEYVSLIDGKAPVRSASR
jgi:hypothetical protein